ncbi:hypothetical protein LTR28_009717 [Elasticomyces elasticus]|nr:hypothetical protein LTR28_009717 [Elasticomyces elasticus]
MKTLCLHGAGTSGDIFSVQTAGLRAKLNTEEHQFDFINAPHSWHAGPGVGPFFDGPYYAWFEKQTAVDVKGAIEVLLKHMRAQCSPYDTVLCFSQGCNVLSSLILYHQMDYPGNPLPFRSAIFICGGIPPYVLNTWIAVQERARLVAEQNVRQLRETSAEFADKIEAMMVSGVRQSMWDRPTAIWDGKNRVKSPSWTMPPLDPADVYGLDLSALSSSLQINIPTKGGLFTTMEVAMRYHALTVSLRTSRVQYDG